MREPAATATPVRTALAHGFEGAESLEDLVAPPDDDPDSEPVPHLPPQLKALEWLDTMGSPDDVPPIDR